jgi:putative transposase
MTKRICTILAVSDGNWRGPNTRAELRDEGARVRGERIARLMRKAIVRGVSRRRDTAVTTRRDPERRPARDLVNRQFTADGHNPLWVANMTNLPTSSGFIYLAMAGDVPAVWAA